MSRAWRERTTAETSHYKRVLRPYVLKRDRYRCQIALQGEWPVRGGMASCRGRADCVHHTLGIKVTGDDVRYMVAACTPCNLKVGDPRKSVNPAHKPSKLW